MLVNDFEQQVAKLDAHTINANLETLVYKGLYAEYDRERNVVSVLLVPELGNVESNEPVGTIREFEIALLAQRMAGNEKVEIHPMVDRKGLRSVELNGRYLKIRPGEEKDWSGFLARMAVTMMNYHPIRAIGAIMPTRYSVERCEVDGAGSFALLERMTPCGYVPIWGADRYELEYKIWIDDLDCMAHVYVLRSDLGSVHGIEVFVDIEPNEDEVAALENLVKTEVEGFDWTLNQSRWPMFKITSVGPGDSYGNKGLELITDASNKRKELRANRV